MEIVYVWADGLYVKAGIEDRKAALLIMIGARVDGKKVLLACESGERESKESWSRILRDQRDRGLHPWRLTIADGHLGIWAALGELHPQGEEQRCWNHKILNVVDKLPKKEQPAAQRLLGSMSYAETRAECEKQRDRFIGILGHDLRTPLQSISMATHLLLRSKSLAEEDRKAAHVASKAIVRMDRLIADVLDFARGHLGAGIPVVPKDCDMAAICRADVEEARARSE